MSQGNSAQGVDVAFSPLSLKNCNELWDSRHVKCLMYLVSFDIGLFELSSLVHFDENTFDDDANNLFHYIFRLYVRQIS